LTLALSLWNEVQKINFPFPGAIVQQQSLCVYIYVFMPINYYTV